jgi:imidazolonepropionase-like amidohydrolase
MLVVMVLLSVMLLGGLALARITEVGSIAVGKEADMVLVDGDPSTDLGALRRVVTVVSDGYVMDAEELRTAAGFGGRPK